MSYLQVVNCKVGNGSSMMSAAFKKQKKNQEVASPKKTTPILETMEPRGMTVAELDAALLN